jgi:protein-disulfide isomerase
MTAVLLLISVVMVQANAATEPVVILLFGDVACAFSTRQSEELLSVRRILGNRVTVEYRHYPRATPESDTFRIHEAVVEAERQGRLWDFHDALIAARARTLKEAEQIAGRVGLDRKAFTTAMKSRVHRTRVMSDIAAGKAMGLSGSPTVFVNGTRTDGIVLADALLREVRAARDGPAR